jgi:crotonobetainyl-CoA:carnitine CoA-transferase CaiB-like acyl-CoA transferase
MTTEPEAAGEAAGPASGSGPLAGVRVIDLGTFIAAPFCGTLLAEFGADVIKVESPGEGDSLRSLGPEVEGLGLLWLQESRNKRAITCDLHSLAGQEMVRDLVRAGYDIVLENFRPGTMERWTLGFDDLCRISPSVILARVSAYGQDGPASQKPGFGRIAQAFGGLTYLCGFPDRAPANPGSATIADYVAGIFAAYGVLVAREHRARTGQGQVIDVALYEAIFRILDSLAITYSLTGHVRERVGSATPLAAPHNHYPTADGKWIAIACTNDKIFGRLTGAMGRPELAIDPRFGEARARVAAREQIDEIVTEWTATHTLRELLRLLDEHAVPSSPIYSIADAYEDEQYKARKTLVDFYEPLLGALKMPAVIPRLSGSPGEITSLGPSLGRHTDQVLMNVLGYSPAAIAELRQRRVI